MVGMKRRVRWLSALLLLLFPPGCTAERLPGEKPFFDRPVTMAAHRGGAGLWPENTLLAFTQVFKTWRNCIIEVDARLTRDGHVVLVHDATVDRTTDGRGAVASLTLAEIKKLDAAYHFSPDGGESFPFRGKGISIPTLEEALEALPQARFQIEMKRGRDLPAAVVQVTRARNRQDQVLLASFDPLLMARARRLAPEIATCFDPATGLEMLRQLRRGAWDDYVPRDDVLSFDPGTLARLGVTSEEAEAIREKGILMQVHTINDPEQMKQWLEFGADSIITDYPNRLAELLPEFSGGNAALE
jgi:glycerophosphoryl diester phosphodiesterase